MSAEHMQQLGAAGLGPKDMELPSQDISYVDLKSYIEGIFPKLKDAGGFQLMTLNPKSKSFSVIPAVLNLTSGDLHGYQRRGRIYIQPLQQDLTTTISVSTHL
jgi:hypothetical protein